MQHFPWKLTLVLVLSALALQVKAGAQQGQEAEIRQLQRENAAQAEKMSHIFDNGLPDAPNPWMPFPKSSEDRKGKPRTDRTDAPWIIVSPLESDATHSWLVLNKGETKSVIHYTLDGSAPTMNTPLYTDPFSIPKGTVVKALAFSGTRRPSKVRRTRA